MSENLNKQIGAILIIKNYLKENNFDGLCNDECGCELNDLAPCDGLQPNCIPAYKYKCNPDVCEHFFYGADKDGFHMQLKKPE